MAKPAAITSDAPGLSTGTGGSRHVLPVWMIAAAVAVGLAAGAGSAVLDVKVFVGLLIGGAFVVSLYYVWLDPTVGLYVAVATAALDTMGKLPFSDQVPITLYQIGIAVTLISVLRAHHLGTRRFAFKRTPVDLPILLYLVLALVSVGFAPNLRVSAITFASLFSSVVLFYLILALVETKDEARKLLLWFLSVAAFLGEIAIIERVTGVSVAGNVMKTTITGIRAKGSFKDPNMLGMMMMMALTAGVALVPGESGRTKKMLVAAAPLVLGALALSFSRGAWVAAIVSISFVVIAYPGSNRRRRVVPLLLCLALAGGIAFSVLPSEFVTRRIMRLSTDKSFMARVYMAEAAVNIAKENPIGVGMGGYPYAYPAFRVGDVRPSLVQSHTAYFTILVELGFLGLILFLWLLWRFARAVWPDFRDKRDDMAARVQLAAAGAVLGILVQAWTYSVELSKLLWFSLGLMMAAHFLVSRNEGSGWQRKVK